jgi:hypothetical protein
MVTTHQTLVFPHRRKMSVQSISRFITVLCNAIVREHVNNPIHTTGCHLVEMFVMF